MSRIPRRNPFDDDKVKARIVPDYLSSGSEHSAEGDDDDGLFSWSLSDLVYGSPVDEAQKQSDNDAESDSELDPPGYDSADSVEGLSKSILRSNADSYRNLLYANVVKAIEVFSCVKSSQLVHRRNVLAFLRNIGYNAAICKTKWESSGGLTAGNHEFIDILRSDSGNPLTRYFVDLDFATEFEIARPTAQYERLVQLVPRIFVGKVEEMKQILKVMSDAVKRSLKSRDLHLPPWRKHRYMQNKWLGPYKRTTNVFPAASQMFPQQATKQNFAVKCSSIGFDASAINGRLLFPATTRTR